MAAPVVQQAFSNYVAEPLSIPFPSSVTAGNLLVACVLGGSGATITVTDSRASTWARSQSATQSGEVEVWEATVPTTGACTVTVTASSTSALAQIYEVSGYATPHDKVNVNATSSGVPVGANFTGLASFALLKNLEIHVQARVLQVIGTGEVAALLENIVGSASLLPGGAAGRRCAHSSQFHS